MIQTDIPARLDRLPWSRFHWLVVVGLGITWILDGLGVTIVGSIGAVLEEPGTLGLSATEVGLAGTFYLVGAVSGALGFGYLTDRFGRRPLFMLTLGIYLIASVLTAFAWDFWSFAILRLVAGTAIGGEYAAINSAIDELIPARLRGRIDLIINGSFWIGAAAGAASSTVLLDPELIPAWLGWRLTFGLGALLSIAILIVRRSIPESPRWLITHGRAEAAEAIVAGIEGDIARRTGRRLPAVSRRTEIHPRSSIGFGVIARTVFTRYPRRALLGFALMAAQAFFYNAIFFTYGLVLTTFLGVGPDRVGLFLLPFAAGNFLGVIILGPLFDTIGRRALIGATYALSGIMLVGTGILFLQGLLSATTMTLLWSVTFFFASPAASAAYLTVSEIFPLETRAMAIAFFYAVGTAIGGVIAPALFGVLIETREPINVFYGYLAGAALMLVAAAIEAVIGVDAEGRSLEDVAPPITSKPHPG